MNRKAFFLGFFSTGGQVLLLRELVSSFNGDELFIGTALFGWLLTVALGAFWGGRTRLKIRSSSLFIIGTVLFWADIIITRLSPMLLGKIPGEIFPFTTAALLSIIFMAPVGIISGWLFAAISRESRAETTRSIVTVYLYEGVGAFVGGLVISMFVGVVFSTLAFSLLVGFVVLANIVYFMIPAPKKVHSVLTVTLILILMIIAKNFSEPLERYFDALKYRSHTVEKAFDTPYSHQAILARDSSYTLLTDNTIEAVYPDLMLTENQLVPALLYRPEAKKILLIGRSEFGSARLAGQFPEIEITALDPRQTLTSVLDEILPHSDTISRIDQDPISFLSDTDDNERFDIIVLNAGPPNNHKSNVFYTREFYERLKKRLTSDGLLFIPTGYDTDRYISDEKAAVLSIIYNTLSTSFNNIAFWPGDITLFLAGDNLNPDISRDSIFARIENMSYTPAYINDYYLTDRLSEFKTDRLKAFVKTNSLINSLRKPILPHYQAIYNANISGSDSKIVKAVISRPFWLPILAVIIVSYFIFLVFTGENMRYSRFGLFLYFTAGVVSLSFELIIFYVYQSLAGSLYSELSLLVGVFMLGLALGTYYSQKYTIKKPELVTLALLLLVCAAFLFTFEHVPSAYLLPYHVACLLLAATATGGLFVAATKRYYADNPERNRGAGYALELGGSALGALLTTTVLLPVLGLHGLMLILITLIVMAFGGSLIRGAD